MMKIYLKFLVVAGVLAAALTTTPSALAACGLPAKVAKPASWHGLEGGARVLLTTDENSDPSIVGMWHVVFTANTSNGAPIPNTVVDNALVVWHSDNTEVMNSVRSPQDGDFCLGVWEQTGKLTYNLNHFAWFANAFPNNTNNGIGEPIGPTRIIEHVTLAADGQHFTGTFWLIAHNTAGVTSQQFSGTLSGTRITVNTSTADLM